MTKVGEKMMEYLAARERSIKKSLDIYEANTAVSTMLSYGLTEVQGAIDLLYTLEGIENNKNNG